MNALLNHHNHIRLAGLFYLIIIVCGVSSEVLFRGPLIDPSSAMTTMQAIKEQLMRFRLSIAADIVMVLSDAALAVLLYQIFRVTAPSVALTAMVFRTLQAAVIAAGLLNLQMATMLFDSPELSLSFIKLHAFAYDVGLIFFGINCLLTAYLIRTSAIAPRWIAIGIGVSGFVYLVGSALRLLAPDLVPVFAPAYGVPLVAETAFCLWLVFHRANR